MGVSKGDYWHFMDRQALLDEMLDTWEKAATADIGPRVDYQPRRPASYVAAPFELTCLPVGLAVEWAVRAWSRCDGDTAEHGAGSTTDA